MKNIKIYGVQELNTRELRKTQSGFVVLGVIAAVCGIIYLAGEIAYIAGRQDSNCD